MLCAIPIEIANRELDGVIYLALNLAKQGMPTLFGERMVDRYVKHGGRPVLYFDIDQHRPTNQRIRQNGGRVYNLNTEGFAFLSNKRFISILEHVQDDVDRFLLWGERQREAVQEFLPGDVGQKLAVTGYPSFDLARERFVPYYLRERIVSAHGDDYLLLNTNNGIFNHAMGLDNYLKMIQRMDEWKMYRDEQYLAFIADQAAYQGQVAHAQRDLVETLAREFPKRHIIVRPHPTEDKSFYTRRLDRYPNVFVTNEGQVREWISSAGFVLHHDCTTSVEALLMGRPVIQFRPVDDERYNDPMLMGIGKPARSAEEVVQIVQAGGVEDALRREQLAALEPSLANVERSAAEAIAELVAEQARTFVETWIPEPLGLWGNILCWRKYASKLLRARQPGRNGRKVRYALSKFPRLPLAEVRGRVERMRALEPALPEVEVASLAMNTFLMRPVRN